MRRFLPVAVVLALAAAGTADGVSLAPPASVSAIPPEAGKPSHLAISARSRSKASGDVRGIVVRLARGFRFDDRAAKRCKVAQAKQTHSCPAGSRIGKGEADLSLKPGGTETADLDLYLAPRQHAGDLAGVVVIANTAGRKGHAVGRVLRLDPDTFKTYGLQLTLDRLKGAIEPPQGATARLREVHMNVGADRTVDGERRDLIRNPGCGSDGWPWELLVVHPQGDRDHYYGSIECSPVPTP